MKRLIPLILALFATSAFGVVIKESKSNTPIDFYTAPAGVVTKQGSFASSGQFSLLNGLAVTGAMTVNGNSVVQVSARYYTTAGQANVDASPTIINYGTKDFDTHNAVTTGASWKFTAPIAGKYLVVASAQKTSVPLMGMLIYFNNGMHTQNTTTVSGSFAGAQVTALVNMAVNDYIDARIYSNGGTLGTAAECNIISITKI